MPCSTALFSLLELCVISRGFTTEALFFWLPICDLFRHKFVLEKSESLYLIFEISHQGWKSPKKVSFILFFELKTSIATFLFNFPTMFNEQWKVWIFRPKFVKSNQTNARYFTLLQFDEFLSNGLDFEKYVTLTIDWPFPVFSVDDGCYSRGVEEL